MQKTKKEKQTKSYTATKTDDISFSLINRMIKE